MNNIIEQSIVVILAPLICKFCINNDLISLHTHILYSLSLNKGGLCCRWNVYHDQNLDMIDEMKHLLGA